MPPCCFLSVLTVFFALQALTDVLSNVAEENQRRDSKLRTGSVRLQCLRCRSEFTQSEEEEEEEAVGGRSRRRRRRRGAAMLPEGVDERSEEELTEGGDDGKGERDERGVYGA